MKKTIRLSLLFFTLSTIGCKNYSEISENCKMNGNIRRQKVVSINPPNSYTAYLLNHRKIFGIIGVANYEGTCFLIHPRVMITAGHNVRKNSFFWPSVKDIDIKYGAFSASQFLFEENIATKQKENIISGNDYSFNYYSTKDWGVIILNDDNAYKKLGGYFTLEIADSNKLKDKNIFLSGYPSSVRPDKKKQLIAELYEDKSGSFYFHDNGISYDFETEHGDSGAPVWYMNGDVPTVFAIHTYGREPKCSGGTIITKQIYDEIVKFCASKNIDITTTAH